MHNLLQHQMVMKDQDRQPFYDATSQDKDGLAVATQQLYTLRKHVVHCIRLAHEEPSALRSNYTTGVLRMYPQYGKETSNTF